MILDSASYHSLNVLTVVMDKRHNPQHRVHPRGSGEKATITDKKAFHAVYFTIFIGHRVFRVGSHATCAHLVDTEHHHTIDAHTVPLQLAVKIAELFLCDHAILLPIQACAFVMQ